jgi:hypothetical protein
MSAVRRSMIRAVVIPDHLRVAEDTGRTSDHTGQVRAERARSAPRCDQCRAFRHPGKPCPLPKGRVPVPIAELIARGLVVEPNGCHSFHGGRSRNPQVKAKVPIRRYVMGLKKDEKAQVRQACHHEWCINPAHLRIVRRDT